MNTTMTPETLSDALQKLGANLPLSENPSSEEVQSYLNAIASYARQQTETSIQAAEANGKTLGLTAEITDALVTSLFSVTPAAALNAIGNHLLTHPDAIATAVAAGIGTEPHPIAIGSFGLTTIIMSSAAIASTRVTASQ